MFEGFKDCVIWFTLSTLEELYGSYYGAIPMLVNNFCIIGKNGSGNPLKKWSIDKVTLPGRGLLQIIPNTRVITIRDSIIWNMVLSMPK